MNAKELRAMKNDMFADRENMDEVLEYATGAFSNDKPMAVTIVMLTFNTLLEGLAKQVEKEDSPVLDVDDILTWADGTLGVLGTEHANKVTGKEASLAYTIQHWKNLDGRVSEFSNCLMGYDYAEMEKRVIARYANYGGKKPNIEEKDRELTHDEAEATYAKTEKEARNGYRVGDKHPTSEEPKQLSLQDIFNAAWQRFIVEVSPPATEQSTSGLYTCRYATKDGLCCAVGAALPDDLIRQMVASSRDGEYFGEIVDYYPDYFADDVLACDSLAEFQAMLHDSMVNTRTGRWALDFKYVRKREKQYRLAAERYNLTVPGE